jgi:predicted HD superfamily hydrolase involved in NAD metabolism
MDNHDHLKKTLSKKRYEHCVAVAELAAALAKDHGWDLDMAYNAGLLHDCAKEWSPKKLISYIRKNRVQVPGFDFICQTNPNLLHAYVGAHWARKNKWLTDPTALRAIQYHTLGGIKMGIPEMIIFIADFASKDRQYTTAKIVRKEAFRNLKSAFRLALGKKIRWNLKASKPIHPFTIQVWNSNLRP